MAAIIGTGLTVTFQSGLFAEILSVSWSGVSRATIDATHMLVTGGMEYLAGSLYDPGTLEVELQMDNPDGAWITMMTAAAETVTVTFSNSNTWIASGFATDFTWTGPLEDRLTATTTLKLSGDVALAAS